MALRGFGLIKLLCAAASGRRTKRKAKFITREPDRVGQQLGMAQSAANSAEPIETLHGAAHFGLLLARWHSPQPSRPRVRDVA